MPIASCKPGIQIHTLSEKLSTIWFQAKPTPTALYPALLFTLLQEDCHYIPSGERRMLSFDNQINRSRDDGGWYTPSSTSITGITYIVHKAVRYTAKMQASPDQYTWSTPGPSLSSSLNASFFTMVDTPAESYCCCSTY